MYPLGELLLLPMSSSAQNNRIAESRRRFGAARPLVHSPTSRDTSRQALESYLITGWIVPPFHIRTGFARPFLYQRPQVATSDQNDYRNIREVLTHAVQARLLPSYQRIGIALSGGLDSAAIAAVCRQSLDRRNLVAFTLDFGPPWSDEVAIARDICRLLDIPLYVVDASPRTVHDQLHKATAAMVSPYGDAVCVPWFLLGKAASDAGCDALLSGEGGDQVFGGWANKPMVSELALTGASLDNIYGKTFHRFLDDIPEMLDAPGLLSTETHQFDVHAWIQSCLPDEQDLSLLKLLRHLNFATKGAGTILPRFTELVESHGIDAHAPFFDTELVCSVESLPDTAILDGATDKALLRQIVAEMTSIDIATLPKRGMGVPSTYWCTGDHHLGVSVRRQLSSKNVHRDLRIRQEYKDKLLSGIVDAPDAYRKRRLGERLWTLFQWEVFREVHSLSK